MTKGGGCCIKCGAEFGHGLASKTHARSTDGKPTNNAYVWCYECGWVTRFEPDFMPRLLSKIGLGDERALAPKEAISLMRMYTTRARFENGVENADELLWAISRSLKSWVMGDDESAEKRVWKLARKRLPEQLLIPYCRVMAERGAVREGVALDWLLELKMLRTESEAPSGWFEQIDSTMEKVRRLWAIRGAA